jgi:transposase
MKVKELLAFIPQQELELLAAETKVDYQVKKLEGIIIFQLILFSMLESQKASLRIMEHLFSSMRFRMISDLKDTTTKYNSIRDRIATINPEFFEKIFHTLFDKFNHLFDEKNELIRYDSTMIALSSGLVEWGIKAGALKSDKVHLKYTIAMKGSFPCRVRIFDNKQATDEDYTIPPTILENDISKTGIVVFDRGVKSRKNFMALHDSNRKFVTRVSADVVHKVIGKNKLPREATVPDAKVNIKEDINVELKSRREWTENYPFRLIKANLIESDKAICFLTNIPATESDAYHISYIYKRRWDIEPLFKFLKQHLNLSHLVARNRNGITVMIYMTLILSILLIAYKKLNKVDSIKITKLKFSLELEACIVKQIVLLTGGDPSRMPHLFTDT